jgi:protein-S-isoprenylcysteine O-methyltransferase Ste14
MSLAQFAEGVARFGPALFFTGIAAFYTVRILQLGRKLGSTPVNYGTPGTPDHATNLTFRAFRVVIWAAALTRALWPPFDQALVPLPGLHRPGVMALGNLLMVAAFARVVRVNFFMGNAWRSGVAQPDDPTPLLTGGPFARCRHPMLAAVMAGQLGLFVAIPSAFTALCLVIGVFTLLRQVELEEADLARRHGERWFAYRATTPRWPWWVRLPLLPGRMARA